MATITLKELEQIEIILGTKEQERNQFEAEINVIDGILKNEYDCKSPEEAQEFLNQLLAERTRIGGLIEQKSTELRAKMIAAGLIK